MPAEKPFKSERRDDGGVDLETQFILRLPEEPAAVLREAIRSGAPNLKERLSVSLESDLRKGMVRIDDRYLYAKVVDLPCIVESLKTIDKKSFYKTADVCQMVRTIKLRIYVESVVSDTNFNLLIIKLQVICKEEPDPITDDESPVKSKKKDPNKVDKKYLYPHGVTPSLKNVRKRRFRKTLKKKNVELPEIEKEVKRLLRVDNEAVNVKWEIVECEEAEPEKESGRDTPKGKKGGASSSKTKASKASSENIPVDEQHIFGEEVSDSEEEDANVTARDLDVDDTRLSEDSRSRFSDSNSMMQGLSASGSKLMTEFKSNMFGEAGPSTSSQQLEEESSDFIDSKDLNENTRINDIRRELYELRNQQSQIEQDIQKIDNKTLKERLQEELDNLMGTIIMKGIELDELLANSQM